MNRVTIIVAGGVGKRMGSRLPKQFLRIRGEVILMKTLRVFHSFDHSMDLVVGLSEDAIPIWKQLCAEENFSIPHKLVKGGNTRFQTVKNALECITGSPVVAIHDAVRPLVNRQTIQRAFEKAEITGNAIPVTDIHESIRFVSTTKNKALPRKHYKLVQTPQIFRSDILLRAYRQNYDPDFTDDASVVEKSGEQIFTVHGNPENIKITTKKDLAVAETLLDFL